MKRLIVCCDGTWNNPDQEENGIPAPTNVFKIFNAIAERDPIASIAQSKYYHPGVGSEGGLVKSILGGAFGVGISRHICSAYHWLGSNYDEGDHIYLFGFSRGAFTARSIGGFLGRGLLDLRGLSPAITWARVKKVYEKGYRVKKSSVQKIAGDDWKIFHQGGGAPVHFIGVWDTVGALGVPDDLELFNFFDNKKKWKFHDTNLGENIRIARHAMSIDEMRSSFSITRWANAAGHPDAIEMWFPGVHSDVGGGYADCDLSNGALLWMIEESKSAGLAFRKGIEANIQADPLGVMHNSFKGVFAKLRSRPRNIPAMSPAKPSPFYPSALERQRVAPIAYPAYHPTRVLAVGEALSVEIFAEKRWSETGVYLPAGHSFVFSAKGEWLDSKDACGWKGTQDGKLTGGDVIRGTASFLGSFEGIFKKLTRNGSTDFLGTKRVENLKWFTLVGAIANDGGLQRKVGNDGSPVPHQYVELAQYESKALTVVSPGYLYCFPNDVWSLYENNHGSVTLTIKRIS